MNEGTEFKPRGSDWLSADSGLDAKWYVGMNQESGHPRWGPLQKLRNRDAPSWPERGPNTDLVWLQGQSWRLPCSQSFRTLRRVSHLKQSFLWKQTGIVFCYPESSTRKWLSLVHFHLMLTEKKKKGHNLFCIIPGFFPLLGAIPIPVWRHC